MIGRDAASIPNVDLPSTTTAGSRVSASLPCRRKNLVNAGQGDVFYGEDDVADLMFREEEVEQDSVMRAYRSDEAMRSIQDTRRQQRRSFFCFEYFMATWKKIFSENILGDRSCGLGEDPGTPSGPPPVSSSLDRRLSRRFSSFRSPKLGTGGEVTGTSYSVLDTDVIAALPVTLRSGSQDEPEVRKRAHDQSPKGVTSSVAPSSSKKKGKKRKLQKGVDSSRKAPVGPDHQDRPSGSRPLFFYSSEEKEAYSKVYEVNSKVFDWLAVGNSSSFFELVFYIGRVRLC
ncbi:hypothetical protein Bca52824_024005 [Brassica carinata]|uniref:Uncharacterized protein n=1 Tax=Brassica carinata TaxID=52824 RepID=A0A8X7VJT8_BRACI|nr:hypothetical protein Bca52824_024005 [Brassica carinata]